MKISKILAYRSNDGCIWNTEEEAIEQNISECLDKIEYREAISYTDIKNWFKDHPKAVDYIKANIKKINF